MTSPAQRAWWTLPTPPGCYVCRPFLDLKIIAWWMNIGWREKTSQCKIWPLFCSQRGSCVFCCTFYLQSVYCLKSSDRTVTSFVSSQPTCPKFCFLFASLVKFTNISFDLFVLLWCSVKEKYCFFFYSYTLVGEGWWWVTCPEVIISTSHFCAVAFRLNSPPTWCKSSRKCTGYNNENNFHVCL